MIIVKTVNFFVSIMNMTWNSMSLVVIPGTNINLQFILIFSILLTLSWKILLSKIIPPLKVDTEIPDNMYSKKGEQNFKQISQAKKDKNMKRVSW